MYGTFTYICLKLMVNVGEYSSPMGHVGMDKSQFILEILP